MVTLNFPGAAVLALLAHAKSSKQHSSVYRGSGGTGPGLLLVKGEGIYLMSNGLQSKDSPATDRRLIYAKGYESCASVERKWRAFQREKIRRSTDKETFVEFIEACIFDLLKPDGSVQIVLEPAQMRIDVLNPIDNPPPNSLSKGDLPPPFPVISRSASIR